MATSRPGTRHRSRPSRRDWPWPGSMPARCSRGMRPRYGWSATTCRSAAGWSIRRAGRSPARPSGSARSRTVKDGVDLDAMLASGELDHDQDFGLVRLQRRDLAGRPEHLDDRRRRPVRGQGGRPRPHRLAGGPRPDAGRWHALRDGPSGQDRAETPSTPGEAEPGHDVQCQLCMARTDARPFLRWGTDRECGGCPDVRSVPGGQAGLTERCIEK